jgi:Pumilio-family RNA binding repeat
MTGSFSPCSFRYQRHLPIFSALDPFGNYLCQKLLEYSTDEQRNVICESVAQELVQISLNMHGTRAVQKMIDFLSTQRQTDLRYDAQIHSIIVALSLHVVTLIKDLNGNHVVQKCLNRLAPEDNQVNLIDFLVFPSELIRFRSSYIMRSQRTASKWPRIDTVAAFSNAVLIMHPTRSASSS